MRKVCLPLLIALVSCISYAQQDSTKNIKTRMVGMGSYEFGQFMKAESRGSEAMLEKVWYQRMYMHVGVSATINERTKLDMVGESVVHFSYVQSKDQLDNDKVLNQFYPHQMEGSYTFGDLERPLLTISAGIFPFKYNPDVRNLGEYLFRSGTYPPVLWSLFDFPFARLTGLHFSSSPIEGLNLHALLTSETQFIPLQDYGASFVGDYTVLKSITIGAGVFASHLFPVNAGYVTPKIPENRQIDTATGDTTYCTFKGTKLMGRLSFDPKPFIPLSLFGKNDLRLYCEGAIIGLDNQYPFYMEMWRRIPFMVGFNLPAFKVLDVFAVELEWYKWNYPNSFTSSFFQSQVPIPDPLEAEYANYNWKENVLKWSVYTKKQVGQFTFVAQVAYDHNRMEVHSFQQGATYYGDAMHKHGDWAWIFKTQYDL